MHLQNYLKYVEISIIRKKILINRNNDNKLGKDNRLIIAFANKRSGRIKVVSNSLRTNGTRYGQNSNNLMLVQKQRTIRSGSE